MRTIARAFGGLVLFLLGLFLIIGWRASYEPENRMIGLVSTAGNKNKSIIDWYDWDLNFLGRERLAYASLGSNFYSPDFWDGTAYLNPQGIFNKKDSKKVLSIGRDGNKEYRVENLAVNDLAVDGDYIYMVNTINGVSHLERVTEEDGQRTEIQISDYVSSIYRAGDFIVAALETYQSSQLNTSINFYDRDLKLVKKSIPAI